MQVTAFGKQTMVLPAVEPSAIAARVPMTLDLPQNFPLVLTTEQTGTLLNRVAAFDFEATPQAQFALMGSEPVEQLNRTLDGFLARINKQENPQLFKLVDSLSDAVAKEKLGDLADAILNAEPSLTDKFMGMFSKKFMQKAMDRVYEDLGRAARLKSKTLTDVLHDMEKKLQLEMNKLGEELRVLDAQKAEYRRSFVLLAEECAFLYNALAKAQAAAPALLAAASNDIARQQEIQDKLQALESVAVSREALMTRMPAEQLVIRQLQNAGISTLQELATTMGDRFVSIRMTLLTIHGAQLVKGTQRLGQANANLDNNLQEARGKLMLDVVTTAAKAPGQNRLEQANNLKRVVTDTESLQAVVASARETNKQQFAEARDILADVRHAMLSLGQQLNPAATIAPRIS